MQHSHAVAGSSVADLPSAPADATPRPPISQHQSNIGINARSKLAALPEELLSNIAIKLGSDDYFALRLTCRDVEAKTLHEFAKEYFSSKCFMFTTSSLKVLVGIAESEKLGHYLKQLYIVTTTIRERVSSCPSGSCCHWKPTTRQREALLDYRADQQKLKANGEDKQYLIKAFKKLSKLNLLAITGDTLNLPDGVECHGLRKFTRTTKTSPIFQVSSNDEYHACLTHTWRMMMLAVAQSGISTIERLETRFGADNTCGISPLDLKFKPATIDVFAKCFANLKDLSMCFRTKYYRAGRDDRLSDLSKAIDMMKNISPAFRTAKNVKLSFDFDAHSQILSKTFLKHTLDLSQITKFVLDSVLIDMETLASTICKLKSVEFLTLHHTELSSGSWVPILKAMQGLPALQHLHLFYLQAPEGRVYFLEKDESADDLANDDFVDYPGDAFIQAAMAAADPDGDWQDEEAMSDTSDEMPPLLDSEGEVRDDSDDDDSESTNAEAGSVQEAPKNTCPSYVDDNFRDPAQPRSVGRGYFVCLQGDCIKEKLPIFIKEYNVGIQGSGGDDYDILMGLAGAVPVPTAAPAPPGNAGTQAGAGAQGTGTQGNGGQTGPPPQGPPPGLQNFLNMMAAGPPPANGAPQTYSFTMPLGSLFGNSPAPPPPPAGNTTQNHPPAGAASASTAQAGPSTTTTATSASDWDTGGGGGEDDDDDAIPVLLPTSPVTITDDDLWGPETVDDHWLDAVD